MVFKMSGWKGYQKSALKQVEDKEDSEQVDKKECYIDESGEKVCPMTSHEDLAKELVKAVYKEKSSKEVNVKQDDWEKETPK